MALYSFNVKIVSRLKLASAVKVAAYIRRSKLYDTREDLTYDFTHKTDLLYSKIFLTPNAPHEFLDQEILWNAAERAENRYDARIGRALVVALPNELSPEENIKLVNEFVELAILPLGMIADVAIHSGHREDELHIAIGHDETPTINPHMHILVTDRPVSPEGFCTKKDRSWNKREIVNRWHEQWEQVQNRAYERNGLDIRVSRDSLEVQGIKPEERVAQKHIGRAATEIQRRGKLSHRYNVTQKIIAENAAKKEKERNWDFELSL